MKILLLEDDLSLREIVQDELVRLGYDVHAFKDGIEAKESVKVNKYDLMLVDINVPGIDGYKFIESIRSDNSKLPVIIISSYTDTDHLSKGYELGCNDYLRKPFSLKELELRVKELIKRNTLGSEGMWIDLEHEFRFNAESLELYHRDKLIMLTQKEQLLIDILIKNRNSIVHTDEILGYVWDNATGSLNSLRVLIFKLRQKLGYDLILNMKNLGYKIS